MTVAEMEQEQDQTKVDVELADPTPKVADAERTQEERFKWRSWVHVGAGAAGCEHMTDGRCDDEGHFHALCRLPNPFQIRDITEKARAAQARRKRTLSDMESDARVILEADLESMMDETGMPTSVIVDDLMDRTFAEDYTNAVKNVNDIEDPDFTPEDDEEIPKLYANIEQDREEYLRQRELPEEQRADDYPELEKTYNGYAEAIEAEMEKAQKPRRDHLTGLPREKLVDMIRNERIDTACFEAYLHTYSTWQMYVCTYKPKAKGIPSERVWPDINVMKYNEDTQVILEVKQTFDDLESSLARSRQGKGS